jgi:hypothetical protein
MISPLKDTKRERKEKESGEAMRFTKFGEGGKKLHLRF